MSSWRGAPIKRPGLDLTRTVGGAALPSGRGVIRAADERTGDAWGGAAFGDSPLLPGAPTPLTRGGSSERRNQL